MINRDKAKTRVKGILLSYKLGKRVKAKINHKKGTLKLEVGQEMTPDHRVEIIPLDGEYKSGNLNYDICRGIIGPLISLWVPENFSELVNNISGYYSYDTEVLKIAIVLRYTIQAIQGKAKFTKKEKRIVAKEEREHIKKAADDIISKRFARDGWRWRHSKTNQDKEIEFEKLPEILKNTIKEPSVTVKNKAVKDWTDKVAFPENSKLIYSYTPNQGLQYLQFGRKQETILDISEVRFDYSRLNILEYINLHISELKSANRYLAINKIIVTQNQFDMLNKYLNPQLGFSYGLDKDMKVTRHIYRGIDVEIKQPKNFAATRKHDDELCLDATIYEWNDKVGDMAMQEIKQLKASFKPKHFTPTRKQDGKLHIIKNEVYDECGNIVELKEVFNPKLKVSNVKLQKYDKDGNKVMQEIDKGFLSFGPKQPKRASIDSRVLSSLLLNDFNFTLDLSDTKEYDGSPEQLEAHIFRCRTKADMIGIKVDRIMLTQEQLNLLKIKHLKEILTSNKILGFDFEIKEG
jgi:hypothetical protein